jgi:hypothetical protein
MAKLRVPDDRGVTNIDDLQDAIAGHRPARARIATRLAGLRVGAFWKPGDPTLISLPGQPGSAHGKLGLVLSDVYRDRFNYPGLKRSGGCNVLRKLRARTIIRAMTITEWILVLTAAAFLLAPVAALSLRPIEDREALLRDVIGRFLPGTRVRN